MLEKPDLEDAKIIACLHDEYRLSAAQVAFLPLGADLNTAVYRIDADDGTSYFLKLRSGIFDETSVMLPRFLNDQGIPQIIAPLATPMGQLWTDLDIFKVILYPFIEGRNGYEIEMSAQHWVESGAALNNIHTIEVPPALLQCIRRETYSPQWREAVKRCLTLIEDDVFVDPIAARAAVFLKARHAEVLALVHRAEQLAQSLQAYPPEFVLCHSDVHAGNILIDTGDAFYIVDWDEPILAPKERDLMFIGGAQGFIGHTAQEEETLFYRGYGQVELDPAGLAYYRYERIVQDIAIFCELLLLTSEGGEDREQSYTYLASNFLPGGTIETACQSDKMLRGM